jgi:outer membrane lipoprotein-sorting protein
MHRKGLSILSLLFLLATPAITDLTASAEDLTPDEIVRRADLVRVPPGSYEIDMTVTDYLGQENRGEKTYRSMVKDLDHALVAFTSPVSEKGKSLLMLQEDVWIYLPNIKKPVRVPLRQRLLGQVAIGDMVRANYSQDYNAILIREDQYEGTPAYVLGLEAKSPSKTYQKINYWVAKENFRPLFAEYFSISGTPLKTLTFKDFRLLDGVERPTLGIFQDSIQKDKITHLRFDKLVRKPFQDMIFTKQYMQTLE